MTQDRAREEMVRQWEERLLNMLIDISDSEIEQNRHYETFLHPKWRGILAESLAPALADAAALRSSRPETAQPSDCESCWQDGYDEAKAETAQPPVHFTTENGILEVGGRGITLRCEGALSFALNIDGEQHNGTVARPDPAQGTCATCGSKLVALCPWNCDQPASVQKGGGA